MPESCKISCCPGSLMLSWTREGVSKTALSVRDMGSPTERPFISLRLCLPHVCSDMLARAWHDYFHSPVLSPSGSSVIGGDRLCFSVPPGDNAIGGNTIVNEEVADCVGSALREIEVVGLWASAVRVTCNPNTPFGLLLQESHQRIKLPHSGRGELSLIGSKEDIAQSQHKAALGFLGLEGSQVAF